jgi:tRNA-2-methylthio-N6-dimethylallyladenosine synthase
MNAAPTYAIWTIGCQMNEADSRHLATSLEKAGFTPAKEADDADLIILNTCVVRQHAEDKIYGRLGALKKTRKQKPHMKIAVMGCLVGVHPDPQLSRRFPFVDYFAGPSDIDGLLTQIQRDMQIAAHAEETALYTLPRDASQCVTAFVPAVLGCSHGCAYCVIPGRRGAEHSRPADEIMEEVRALAAQGVREVMLLGQIVDRYGMDASGGPDLADLLQRVADIAALYRVRFLTSHPRWITDKLLDTVAAHEKICPQMEIAVQSGSNQVLQRMRRGYTVETYRALMEKIRSVLPDAAIHTDMIVGFPGETEQDFMGSYHLLRDMRFDKVHIAKYSERPGTPAAALYTDDVNADEKERRRKMLEALQKEIQTEKCREYPGRTVEVLIDGHDRGRWRGRTRRNKIVFVDSPENLLGKTVPVKISWAGPFSMIAEKERT